MARDLASDVDKILRSNNKYLRKKASLAAIRLLKKEPDLIEQLGERIFSLLKDKAHGVLITGLQLMIEVLDLIPSMIEEYQKLVPSLVRLLRNFISMGFSPEHDVAGITDPFVQVKLLHILKRLGKNNEETSDQMNDVLAQVATNTETAKNAGNAILYECVQTIMEIESDSGLRVLAVNILGRFLLNRDNNIRYVALNSLSKVVSEDISAVQRHRSTIVECLKDGDISIRQRALELIYQLVNDQNVISLTAELLNYLIIANTEHKANLVSKIMQLVERYSPSKKWRVDTVLTMLSMSGNQIDDSISRTAIIYIAQAEGLQGYAAHRLFRILQDDTSQQGLLHVAVWCIGEYSDLLVKKYAPTDGDGETYTAIAEASIIGICDKCLKLYNADTTTKGLILNALMKLSVKISPAMRHLITELIVPFQTSMSLELQQRSSEYSVLLNSQWDSLRGELMAKMPMVDEAALKKRRAAFDTGAAAFFNDTGDMSVIKTAGDTTDSALGVNVSKTVVAKSQSISSSLVTEAGSSSSNVSLLDLDDIFGGGASESSTLPTQSVASSFGYQPQDNQQDLLSDMFSSSTLSPSIYPPIPPKVDPIGSFNGTSNNFPEINQNAQQNNNLLNLMPVTSSSIVIQAYDKGGLQIFMELSKTDPSNPSSTKIFSKFVNLTNIPMDSISFQAAVPKYLKLEMLPASSSVIPPHSNGVVTQEIRVVNSMHGEKNIMLKLKIGYSQGGVPVDDQAQVSNFPAFY
eukprot:CAMPEP_0119038794 /NCGR_PEP_ID=MMETSP1177-20130426/7916_1 /TAXON_ID=2985 /ORGANISM="Ochromonas sp, Strain CCMP1899" /LENGTH=746 /DNA_ID=CAMNT_0007001825 /DNA_START=515 /DNA_END=2755 /DNA_ORIENTATION=-